MSEDNLRSENVMKRVWSLFDVLRSEPIRPEDYTVILFILSAYRDNVFSSVDFMASVDLKERFVSSFDGDNNKNIELYQTILGEFENTLLDISREGYLRLFNVLENINHSYLSDNFSFIFDVLLYRIANSFGKYAGGFIQPVEITRLMCSLTGMSQKYKLFNPFAGPASFAAFLQGEFDYYGQEKNRKTWAIGLLRLKAHGIITNTNYDLDDSILNWPTWDMKFDLVITNPPFGLRTPKKKSIEQFLIESSLRSLSAKGKFLALLPQSFVFRQREHQLRVGLVQQDLIDTIINLPGGILPYTGIPVIILVLSKKKAIPGHTLLINAEKFVISTKGGRKVLDDRGLIDSINSDERDSSIIRLVDNNELASHKFILHVPRFFINDVIGQKLGDVLHLKTLVDASKSSTGKLVTIGDLSSIEDDYILDFEELKIRNITRSAVRGVKGPCLLLATKGRSIKPTYFSANNKTVYLSGDIVAFDIDEKYIDPAFLISELHEEYVLEQLDVYFTGNSLPSISREDLMEIKIKIPTYKEQRKRVEDQLKNKIDKLISDRNISVKNQFEEFASLKHSTGRPRQNILDWTDNLIHFIQSARDKSYVMDNAFQDYYGISMSSVLHQIKNDINQITTILEKGEKGFLVEDFSKEIISLASINQLIKELSDKGLKFRLKKNVLKGGELKKRGIEANLDLLQILLDNVITNTEKYGFDSSEDSNELMIELEEIDDYLVLEFKNNGKPFPNKFQQMEFTRKFSTTDNKKGTGLGGYDIHRIASYFDNPQWQLILNEDPIYPVKLRFQFPIKTMN